MSQVQCQRRGISSSRRKEKVNLNEKTFIRPKCKKLRVILYYEKINILDYSRKITILRLILRDLNLRFYEFARQPIITQNQNKGKKFSCYVFYTYCRECAIISVSVRSYVAGFYQDSKSYECTKS